VNKSENPEEEIMKIMRIVLMICVVICVNEATAKVSTAPYYYLNTGEALVITTAETEPQYSFSTSICGDFAAFMKIGEKFTLIPFYELVYQGPGLSMQTKEGANFQQQSQEHAVFVKGNYRFSEAMSLNSQVEYVLQLTRTGTNERWADGMYNLYSFGFDIYADLALGRTTMKPGFYYVNCTYPNYISLLGMIDKSLAIPQQDQERYKIYLTGEYALPNNMFLEYRPAYTFKNFKWQKVIDETGVEQGPLQQDGIVEMGLKLSIPRLKYPYVPGLVMLVDYAFTWYYSNQNSIQTTDTGSIIPNSWMPNFYDYRTHELTPQIYYTLPNKIRLILTLDYSLKDYASRPPQDYLGTWLTDTDQKEYDLTRTLTAGVSFPLGSFSLGINYVLTSAVSNMKYERYYKYTYDNQTIMVDYTFEY